MKRRKLILVVEDEEDMRNLLRLALRGWGFHVQATSSGREAVDLCRRRTPDAILLDVRLPEMGGIETLRALQELGVAARSRVIMVTAYADLETASKSFEMGADEYLSKPFDLEDLESILRRHLEGMVS